LAVFHKNYGRFLGQRFLRLTVLPDNPTILPFFNRKKLVISGDVTRKPVAVMGIMQTGIHSFPHPDGRMERNPIPVEN